MTEHKYQTNKQNPKNKSSWSFLQNHKIIIKIDFMDNLSYFFIFQLRFGFHGIGKVARKSGNKSWGFAEVPIRRRRGEQEKILKCQNIAMLKTTLVIKQRRPIILLNTSIMSIFSDSEKCFLVSLKQWKCLKDMNWHYKNTI